ncbi:hypothetical protein [Nocardia mangyaensis]|uniref:hypothetical protein n=1 Tax=Nocardia mangyaensis TaxID=2213200 RepID=UPI002674EC5C|nr:hypothetical protein [Nocardia mangyaensis]MDO3647735.1 hypothetical protein [Nocardia mangyaensis]
MTFSIGSARAFMTANARALDRHRFEVAVADNPVARAAVISSLGAYRNPDGGYGWGLESDLRAPESQPSGALHAWEAVADAGTAAPDRTAPLLTWLQRTALEDGGLPFALPIADPTACAPFWAQADPNESSLQITAAVTTQAMRAARADESIRTHPWLKTSIDYCFRAIDNVEGAPFAYVLSFALQFLDIATDTHPRARRLLDHLAQFVPADGVLAVTGGAEGETIHLLDYAPEPGRPIRDHFTTDAVETDLDRLERGQQPDGGWAVDFTSYSAIAALEWRGYATVRAVTTLRRNGR